MKTQNTSNTGEPRKRRSFLRRVFRWMLVALPIMTIAIWIFGEQVMSRLIDWQLKTQLADRANAQLETARVVYTFPYTVRIDNAHLVVPETRDGRGWRIDVGKLELTLAKLPVSGPLVIQSLTIEDPAVLLGPADPSEATTAPTTNPADNSTPDTNAKKLSDLFQLRLITIKNGRMEFDPGSQKHPRRPVVWDHMHAIIKTQPTNGGNYQFEFKADDKPLAMVDVEGAFDIDTMFLDMRKMSVDVQCDPETSAAQLPPTAQELFRQFRIGGHATFDAAVKIPLTDPARGVFTAKLTLEHGTARLPGLGAPVDSAQFTITASNLPDITRDMVSTTLPTTTLPTRTLPTAAAPVHLWLDDLAINCGTDAFRLASGGVVFDPVTRSISIEDFRGVLDAGDGPVIPADYNLKLHLPFVANGEGSLTDGMSLLDDGSSIDVTLRDAAVDASTDKIPFRDVNAQITLQPHQIEITDLNAATFKGKIAGELTTTWLPHGVRRKVIPTYYGNLQIAKLDLHEATKCFSTSEATRAKATGVVDFNLHYHGVVIPGASSAGSDSFASNFGGSGDFDIQRGNFVDIPVLKEILGLIKDKNGATVGEAAGTFTVANKVVTFNQAAASAPILGAQGSGTIAFDQQTNMTFVITPLADWGKDLKATDESFLSGVGSVIATNVQGAVNTVQSKALYQVRVTGPISKLETKIVFLPEVSQPVMAFFDKMHGVMKDNGVLQELKHRVGQ